jgi:diguanylate cyclase (GGDEF)-like protein/PAS domain S-box-containing protein
MIVQGRLIFAEAAEHIYRIDAKNESESVKKKFITRALLLTLLLAGLALFLHEQMMRGHRNDLTLDTSLRLATLRTRLEKEIIGNLLRIQGAASFIALNPDLDAATFASYAKEALRNTNLLKNLAAAPDLVLSFIYPLEGNSGALGLDYRKTPEQWEQARLAMETGDMVVAGPLALAQGGVGLVGRAPVIIRRPEGDRFWGLVSAVIDIDQLYANVGLNAFHGLEIAIRGVDGKGAQGKVFFGDAALFDPARTAVLMPVNFPSGSWQMAALPDMGWNSTPSSLPLMYALIGLFYVGALAYSYRDVRKSHELATVSRRLMEAQTLARFGNWDMNFKRNVLWWSDETYRIFGVDKAEFSPSLDKFFSMIHPQDQRMVEREYTASVESGQPYSMTHRIVRPDGGVRHVYSQGANVTAPDGSPVRSAGTVLDITELKEAEAALRNEEQKLRAMSDASLDAIIMINARGIVLFWNKSATKLFGYTEEEAVGQEMHDLITTPEDSKAAKKGLPHFADSGKGPVVDAIYEFTGVRKDRTTFPVERAVSSFQMNGEWYAVGVLRDVTKRQAARKKLASYAKRIALASEAGGVGIWEWDTLTNELTWDMRMYTLYAVLPGEFSGLYQAWTSRVHPEDLGEAEKSLMHVATHGGDWHHLFRIMLPDGGIRHIEATARAHKDDTGRVVSVVGINLDVTEKRRVQAQLERLATTDSLTGLFSRGHFTELGAREVEHAKRYGETVSVIMFDADKFKVVNDTHGHDVGDMVLKSIARTAGETLREVDVLGRIGGEEFAAVLPQTNEAQAVLVAERLREEIAAARVPLADGSFLSVTVSLGVCEMRPGAESLDALLKGADTALYKAKSNGRNRVETA